MLTNNVTGVTTESKQQRRKYKVELVVSYLGWVDFDFGYSTIWQVQLGQMIIWQNRLVCLARWSNTQIKVNQTQY